MRYHISVNFRRMPIKLCTIGKQFCCVCLCKWLVHVSNGTAKLKKSVIFEFRPLELNIGDHQHSKGWVVDEMVMMGGRKLTYKAFCEAAMTSQNMHRSPTDKNSHKAKEMPHWSG